MSVPLGVGAWGLTMVYNYDILRGMKRTTIFLAEEDRAAIRRIQERYGVSTDSDAIRLAVRVLAEAETIAIAPLPQAAAKRKAP